MQKDLRIVRVGQRSSLRKGMVHDGCLNNDVPNVFISQSLETVNMLPYVAIGILQT